MGDGNTYISQRSPQICLLLLPEEVYAKVLHQWREHVCDVLQHFRSLVQRIGEMVVGVDHFGRCQRVDHAAAYGCKTGFATAVMRCAEEEDAVGAYEDGV
jgi:hypothetical protein